MTLTQVEQPSFMNEWELTQRLNELFQLAKEQKRKFQAGWRRNYLLTSNRQYSISNEQPWTPNVTDSEIFPIISSRIAWFTDQKITATVSPAAEPESTFYAYQQELGNHLTSLLSTIQIVDGWDKEETLALWDAAQFGAAIFKSVWDSGLTDGLGNVALRRIDPWGFYPDPNATSFDDCTYMFEIRRMSVTEIRRRFPNVADRVIQEAAQYGSTADESSRPQPGTIPSQPMAQLGNLPTSTGSVWGLPGQTTQSTNVISEGVNIIECWVRENHEFQRQSTDPLLPSPETVVTDDWRVVVYSGSTVLLDEFARNLWQYNLHPYTRYVDEETGEFWPVPIVSHLAPAQIAINRLLSAMQANAELCGNPIFMDVNGSGLARTAILNRPGLRLTMDNTVANSSGAKPDWLAPPPVSSDVPQMIQFWISRMENISGIQGIQKGQTPPGRNAQQTIQSATESASVRIRQSIRNMERTLSKAYGLLAHLIIQNYSVPRVVAILGEEGKTKALRLAAWHFYSPAAGGREPLKFALQVQAGSSNPTSRQARIAEADALLSMHAIDAEAVLSIHNFPHWKTIVQRMQQRENQLAQIEAQAHSQPHGPGTGHEH